MKNLNNYIIEKFQISKDIENKFSPDNMDGNKILIYSTEPDDEGESQDDNEYLDKVNDNIDEKYYGFICFYNGISKDKLEDNFIMMNEDFFKIFNKIVNGKDAGYEISLSKGRYLIEALNSGSRAKIYIYALTKKGYNEIMDWVDNDTDNTNIFFDEKNFEEIKDVTII